MNYYLCIFCIYFSLQIIVCTTYVYELEKLYFSVLSYKTSLLFFFSCDFCQVIIHSLFFMRPNLYNFGLFMHALSGTSIYIYKKKYNIIICFIFTCKSPKNVAPQLFYFLLLKMHSLQVVSSSFVYFCILFFFFFV